MIDDAFGHMVICVCVFGDRLVIQRSVGDRLGQYVQHSLVENESHACMKDAIEAFKEHNPAWDKIRAFMIDKDFGEISLLQKEFPLARVLISHFHLKKYLRTEMSRAEYDGRNGVDVDRVEDSLDMMIKARDEEEYDRGLRYIDVGRLRKRHLGNHTNNRLEASWGALKDILKPEMELDECVETLPYVTQCIAGIETYRKSLPTEDHSRMLGVTIKKLGTFTEKDQITIRDWNDEMPGWQIVSKLSRISLPSPLNDCTTVDLEACAKRLETVNLKSKLDTRFGPVAVPEVAFFRRSEWLDDSCVKLVMSYLMDQEQDAQGRSRIGCVNPLYATVVNEEIKRQTIARSPFHKD
ncbi:hypothetical protein PHMEG_0004303 [Phytophthora megakarya]|uniref:ZSWIM1/3 RNaseH-like domain-containing protein n=1 Tax=Phytophthora megakarya TaxID=4795 RepID=A0A225WU75_9STRA|nr:hypothetical protein PHMEG_0004303 [Phytophthora megakarya]